MNRNPLARYTAEDLQKHPWFTRRFNDEVPLSAHEVVTSFSFEQSFTRVYFVLIATFIHKDFESYLFGQSCKI